MCEFITGGGLEGAPIPAGLAAEGEMMLTAAARDLLGLGGLELSITRDSRLGAFALPLHVERITPTEEIWERWRLPIEGVDAVWPIAPETQGILEQLSRLILERQRILLGSRPEAVAIAASKLATAKCLAAQGIPVVETVPSGGSIPHSDLGWVVKPDDGAGCEDTYYFKEFDELGRWLENQLQDNYMVQPYLRGTPASLSLVCCDGAARVLACNEQLIETGGHKLHCLGVIVNALRAYRDQLEPLGLRIARALPGLWGYVGIDIVITQHGPVVMEINPRLTTSYVGLHASIGHNPAGLILGLLQGDKAPLKIPLADEPVLVRIPHAA